MTKLISVLNKYLILRYIISGCLASGIDILLFSLLIKSFGLHYIISGSISVTVSFLVRFYLQKTFAFKDRNLDIHKQIIMYSILYILSIAITTLLLYVFIDKLHMWYILAQVITIGIVACMSFFVYKHIIFNRVNTNIKSQ